MAAKLAALTVSESGNAASLREICAHGSARIMFVQSVEDPSGPLTISLKSEGVQLEE